MGICPLIHANPPRIRQSRLTVFGGTVGNIVEYYELMPKMECKPLTRFVNSTRALGTGLKPDVSENL